MRDRGVAIGVAVALRSIQRSGLVRAIPGSITTGKLSTSTGLMSRSAWPGRVRAGHVERLRETLSKREWAVLRDVARLRLVTGAQLERLHFAELTAPSRAVVRRRVLGRMVEARVLATLERRVGGVRAGSKGFVYHVDTAGKRLLVAGTVRSREPPGERYVRHVLAVAGLYVDLAEAAQEGELRLDRFDAEPASWWPDGQGGTLKPDGYVAVSAATHTDHWWVEVDLTTEHLPTLKRKFMVYVNFWQSGQLGPGNIVPRVLVTVLDTKRYSEVVRLIRQLPAESEKLFVVSVSKDAARVIVRCLNWSE
jgi:hypothetical protein